jgi:hypothetical protein
MTKVPHLGVAKVLELDFLEVYSVGNLVHCWERTLDFARTRTKAPDLVEVKEVKLWVVK